MIILVVLAAIILPIIAHRHYKKWINPVSILVIPHCASMLMLLGSNFLDKNLSAVTYTSFFALLMIYTIGTYFGSRVKINTKNRLLNFKPIRIRIVPFIVVISLIVDVIVLLYIRDIQSSYGIMNAFLNLSDYNLFLQNEGINSSFGIAVFLAIPWSLILQSCMKCVPEIRERLGLKIFIILEFVLCFIPFVSARRSTLVLMIVMNLFLFYLSSNKERKHNYKRFFIIVGVIYIILLFFSVTQQMMNKESTIHMTCFGITIPRILVDIFGYFAGNYKYLDAVLKQGLPKVDVPFISTFRVAYIYLSNLLNWSIDTTTPFALRFLEIGNGAIGYHFNTTSIQYYFMLDSGVLYYLEILLMGFLSGYMYNKLKKESKIRNFCLCAFQFTVVFMSFREYDLIFLSNIIPLIVFWIFGAFRFVDKNREPIEI